MADPVMVQRNPEGCGCKVVSRKGIFEIHACHGGRLIIPISATTELWLAGAIQCAFAHAKGLLNAEAEDQR